MTKFERKTRGAENAGHENARPEIAGRENSGVATGCAMHMGPALWGPKFARRCFIRTEPHLAENCFRVNVFLATTDRACTQIKERFHSMNAVAMTFGIMFPSILLSVSGDGTQQPNH